MQDLPAAALLVARLVASVGERLVMVGHLVREPLRAGVDGQRDGPAAPTDVLGRTSGRALGYQGLLDDSNMAPENDFAASIVAEYPDPDVTHLGLAAASATSEVIQRWLSNVQVNTNTTMNGSRQQPTTGTDRRVLAYETSSTMQAIGLINSPAQRRTSRREPGNADRADTTAQAR